MTNAEIRIKVAESLGMTGVWPGGYWNGRDASGKLILIPNYPESLDACAEMVKSFTYEEADEFDDHLCDICKRDNDLADNPAPWRFAVTNATPLQRCLAYLKTKGLIP